jgi:hypothetical protein
VFLVARDPEINGLAAGLGDDREQHRAIGVADAPELERPARNEFVASGHHADPRARMARDLRDVEACEHTDVRRGQHRPRIEHRLVRHEIAALGADVRARLGGLFDHDDVAFRARELDHHDRVGTFGDRRACHDADGLARADWNGRRPTGGQLAHDLQPHRCAVGIGRAHGVSVHARVGERRYRLTRDHRLRKHETDGITNGVRTGR